MDVNAETIAKARVVYHQLQDEALASSPLAGMEEWIRDGAPPSAGVLRAGGLSAESERQDIRLARRAFIRRWGFSIPCAEAVAAIGRLGPLVEIGAGSAYWTALLRAAGHDVIATDILAAGEEESEFSVGRHAPSERLDGPGAIVKYPERDVFCSWPTEGADWAMRAAVAIRPGRGLALIGDGRGGCTATASLFDVLDAIFTVEAVVELPQFPRIRDRLTIYRRT
ncbi:hypothetical protein [Phenylobacterium sp.]|uniref:hypothetical protein n=1 Tax=Phenylobacterium sp. TaxID=1871053 RepID=UPI0035657075